MTPLIAGWPGAQHEHKYSNLNRWRLDLFFRFRRKTINDFFWPYKFSKIYFERVIGERVFEWVGGVKNLFGFGWPRLDRCLIDVNYTGQHCGISNSIVMIN